MSVNFRGILSIIGYTTLFVGVLLLFCVAIEVFTNSANIKTFSYLSISYCFLGFIIGYTNKSHINAKMNMKDGYLLAFIAWFWVGLISAFPFMFSNLKTSFFDSFFESVSALTTTGSTIYTHLDDLSYGMHLWRGLLEWVGGIGIIFTGLVIFPQLKYGGMIFFRFESFETFNTHLAKAREVAKGVIAVYITLTIGCFLGLYMISGWPIFDALIHSFTALSTAGMSTKDASVGYFHSYSGEIILTIFMFAGGMPLMLISYLFFQKKTLLFKDEQFLIYTKIFVISSVILGAYLFFINGFDLKKTLIWSPFAVANIITGCGFIDEDYSTWGTFPTMLLFLLMFIGGCGGSPSSGPKVFRIVIAYRFTIATVAKTFSRNRVIIPYYNREPIQKDYIDEIMAFFFLLLITIFLFSLILSLFGLDFVTSLTAVAASATNVGTGVGKMVGPAGNYAGLPNGAKFILTMVMFLGRVEIFGFYVIFFKSFWSRN